MAVITISRGSYSHGKEVAEKVAQRLGYECVSREIILEASEHFDVPEFKLLKAIQDAPSFLDRITYGRQKYIAYIRATLLNHLKKDNVVYHGFAGHYFVRDVPHALKVRIIADFEDRVRLVMERDGLSRDEAVEFLNKLDAERRKWGQRLYGIDTNDPGLYDLVIHIKALTIDDAVDLICDAAGRDQFRATEQSRQKMEDLALAAEVKASIVEIRPDAEVEAESGVVTVSVRLPVEVDESQLIDRIRKACDRIPGVKDLSVKTVPTTLYQM
ncbi:AAA family ATPase [Thermodesulforhabdus norvegica]|uniref:Cytidylate kinase n=1 Tax=Thermodesulforhabdus norvegica TaxID=39841 RepID=A0A1I4TWV8_9BACT|nr:cytidylate kinase-like family protein [Thermodesulforhabdus norvegica]SFM81222.1 Cytidylate kinase [Thermodesulforhabdus norvegica]